MQQHILFYIHRLFIGTAILAITSIVLVQPAQAEGGYFGFGFGTSEFDTTVGNEIQNDINTLVGLGATPAVVDDDSDSAFKWMLGYEFNDYIAIEASYIDFGEYGADVTASGAGSAYSSNQTVEATAITGGILGKYPIGKSFSGFGKFALAYWEVEGEVRAVGSGAFAGLTDGSRTSDTGVGFMYGFGASYKLGEKTRFLIEFEQFIDVGKKQGTGETDIDLITGSIIFLM